MTDAVPPAAADDVHDQWIDQALQALDGGRTDSEFILHKHPDGIALCCGLCPSDDHGEACKGGTILFTVGSMELWEFVHDAREHYEEAHRG